MNDLFRPGDAAKVLFKLARGGLKPPKVTPRELTPLEIALREWQAARLTQTHGDFLDHPTFGPAARFFLSDIYAGRDFSRRDAELESLFEFLRALLPPDAMRTMSNSVKLNEMTHRLDAEVVGHLRAMGCADSFTEEQYEAAYRQGDYETRREQIALAVEVMRDVAGLHHVPLVGPALHSARPIAHRLGWAFLYDFLARGFDVWANIPDPAPFLSAVWEREHELNDRLFGKIPLETGE